MSWKLAGNTAGFGQVWDGRPFWVGNFDGQGGGDVLFYYPGDQNWWLGRFDGNGALGWNLAGNTTGFGDVADGRPFGSGTSTARAATTSCSTTRATRTGGSAASTETAR